MADEKQLGALLYAERGYHFLVLAEEYDRLADEFKAKAADARRQHMAYREGAGVCIGDTLKGEIAKVWDDNLDKLYES